MKNKARIGTSGFGIARSKYVQLFSCVEVQHTFYQPPKIATLERWREDAPPDFEFVLKAWQLITHDAKSPTYRRLKRKLSEFEKQEAGYFRSTGIVKEAWEVTRACARALAARTILFQCPASFKQTKENISNLEKFFGNINRENSGEQLSFCWEPRGDWEPKLVKSICKTLNLWHAVDPFKAESVTPGRLYFRLHGKGGWRYEYEEAELRELAGLLISAGAEPAADPPSQVVSPPGVVDANETPYIFFNNARMTQDALRFHALTEDS